MKAGPSVLVAGSLAHDSIMDFPGVFTDHILPEKLHSLSVSFMVQSVRRHFGGTAGNIAYTLSQLGVRPIVLSQLGREDKRYEQHAKKCGMDTRFVWRSKQSTAGAWIMTDKKDNQISAFHPGAMVEPASRNQQWKKQKYAMAIIAAGNAVDRRVITAWCRQSHTPFLFDPGQQVTSMTPTELRECLRDATALLVNDYELEMVQKNLKASLKQLLQLTETILTTLGAKGSRIQDRKGSVWNVPAVKPKKLVDPTGAGDAYRGGLIAGLLAAKSWPEAGRWGAACAAKAIEVVGTQEHTISFKELKN